MNNTNVERASRLDNATLGNVLDRHGLNGQCYRIQPRSTASRLTGRAWTLLYGPAGTVGDYVDDVAPGSVIVLDNGGRDARERPRHHQLQTREASA